MRKFFTLALVLASAVPAASQDLSGHEIIVTASRIKSEDYDSSIPLIGLRKIADFAVQEVMVAGDTRDGPRRRDEIFEMVKAAIERSP